MRITHVHGVEFEDARGLCKIIFKEKCPVTALSTYIDSKVRNLVLLVDEQQEVEEKLVTKEPILPLTTEAKESWPDFKKDSRENIDFTGEWKTSTGLIFRILEKGDSGWNGVNNTLGYAYFNDAGVCSDPSIGKLKTRRRGNEQWT